MASRFDRRDPGEDEAYTNGLGRAPRHTGRHPADPITCAYCGNETPANPVRSSHPMCPRCRDRQLAQLPTARTMRGAA